MAKFCGNCGARMEDSAKVCGNCGTPFDSGNRENGVQIVNLEKKKELQRKIKKFTRMCIVLITLIVAAVIVIRLISSYTGANGLLRKVMAAYEEYDIDTLISLSSDMYYYGSDDYAESYFENTVGYMLDTFESSVGHSYKLSYEVNEIYTVSQRKLNEMLNQIEYSYTDFDVTVIEKVVIADLIVTAKQGGISEIRDIDIVMSNEKGTWRLLYIQ